MSNLKEKLTKGGVTAVIVITILVVCYGLSWIVTCGIIKLITMCFGLTFKWSIATGIWLIICILRSVFNVTVKKQSRRKLTFLGCGGEIVKYNIKTVRTLVTDNKKSFRIGEDIAFTLFNKVTNHHDHYIGNIVEMTDTSIKISNIEIDRYHEDGEMIIDLENIESNSCNYVYCD